MTRIYFAENAMIAHHVKSLLEADGISAEVTGETLAAMAGIGPVDLSVQPVVWVHDPTEYERALEIIRRYEKHERADGHATRPTWSCPNCDESVDGGFELCWHCGAERPGSQASDGDAGQGDRVRDDA
ncbi:MAG: DUF2007 domain-containing protein [Planctomycetes bacterium]|nr:DUF2007 domain-containing protein [Planctomycetota bacterium]